MQILIFHYYKVLKCHSFTHQNLLKILYFKSSTSFQSWKERMMYYSKSSDATQLFKQSSILVNSQHQIAWLLKNLCFLFLVNAPFTAKTHIPQHSFIIFQNIFAFMWPLIYEFCLWLLFEIQPQSRTYI
jgi:hypothetical protein